MVLTMNVMHSNSRSALIVGAGIAGLTAAAVLRQQGWRVIVAERGQELRTGGYKVDARGAGVEVLDRLGLLDQARALHCDVRAGSVVTADGRVVAAMGGDTFGGRGHEDVEIERGDLLWLLASVAGEIRFGVGPAAIDDTGSGVEVRLTDGTTERVDVVLGADGLRSTVREFVTESGSGTTEVHSLGHAIAVVQLPTSMGLTTEEMTYVAPGTTALLYATARQAQARAMLLFAHAGPLPRDRAAQVTFLRERFAGQGWRVPEILAALDGADDIYLDSVSQVSLPRWSRGAVGLVGDSAACASPASGQGTTLGLVTAYVTAVELASTPEDVPGALTRAEASLRSFVEANQALGPANLKRMVLPSARAVRSTLTMLRVLNVLPGKEFLLGAVARKLDRASQFTLPPA